MRTVFKNHSEVCHIYASQSQEHGSAGNIFFEGRDIYSYGSHYLAGRIYSKGSRRAVIVNSYRYSHSTAKHLSEIRSATSHLIQIEGDPRDPKKSLDRAHAQIGEAFYDWFSRRFNRYEIDADWARSIWKSYQEDVSNLNEACDFFNYPSLKINLTEEHRALFFENIERLNEATRFRNTPEQLAKRSAEQVKRAEYRERKEAEKAALEALEQAKQIEVWKAGGERGSKIAFMRPQGIRIKGDNVETTSGASVPLAMAMRAYQKLKLGKLKAGDKVGVFEVSDCAKGLLYVGCHTLSIAELDSVLGPIQPKLRLVGAK